MPQQSEIIISSIENEGHLWEKFIPKKPNATVYHTLAWKKVIEESFGHKSYYLMAKENGKIVDALPFFLIKKPFLGKKIISTPYQACFGGFISNNQRAKNKIIETALNRAKRLNVNYLEIRTKSKSNELKEMGFIERTPLFYSEVILEDIEKNWSMLSRNHRRNVRLSQKRGVVIRRATKLEEVYTFYKILEENFKKFGTPIFDIKFFKNIWVSLIPNFGEFLLAIYEGEIIGGHLLLYNNDTVISKYSGFERKFSKLYPSYALYWEAIKIGIEKGLKFFNLGTTDKRNCGLVDFKTKWGAQNKEVYFYYYPVRGGIPQIENYFNSFSIAKKIWRRIPPNIITRLLGQKINEWIC